MNISGRLTTLFLACGLILSAGICSAEHVQVRFSIDPFFPFWMHPRVTVSMSEYGILDLDVSPEEAAVYVDGEYLGICDQFDGFPDYLYLKEGTYTIAFKYKGYLDFQRQVKVKPGREIEFNTRMRRVTEGSYPETRSDEPEVIVFTTPADSDGSDRPTETEHEMQQEKTSPDYPADQEQASPHSQHADAGESPSLDVPGNKGTDQSQNHGFLEFRVFPKDASIYIDQEFLGTAGKMNGLADGYSLSPGTHVIDIMMPGYEPYHQETTVTAGEKSHVRVILTGSSK